jgi:TPR repeat protein
VNKGFSWNRNISNRPLNKLPWRTVMSKSRLLALCLSAAVLSLYLGAHSGAQIKPTASGQEADPYKLDLTALEQRATQGDAAAEAALGKRYLEGRVNGQSDASQAFIWISKAASQGYAIAEEYLAEMYDYGVGVAKDPSQALIWRAKATAQASSNQALTHDASSAASNEPVPTMPNAHLGLTALKPSYYTDFVAGPLQYGVNDIGFTKGDYKRQIKEGNKEMAGFDASTIGLDLLGRVHAI